MHQNNSELLRLFTAIALPQEFKNDFNDSKLNSKIKGNISWTKPENLHITTCFIGETEQNQLETIKKQIAKIAETIELFQLSFRNIQLAPPKKKPYMIWANYNTNNSFFDLCTKLYSELLGIQKKNYFPHVTLARFKGYVTLDSKQRQRVLPSIEVSKIGLWKSVLTPNGPNYEMIEEFSLKL